MVAGHTPAGMVRFRSAVARDARAPTTARHERSSSSTFAKGSGSSRWRAGGRRAWLRRPCQPAGGERQAKGRTVFEIPSGVDGKSNTVRPGWSRSRQIEHLRLRLRRTIGWEARILGPFLFFFLARSASARPVAGVLLGDSGDASSSLRLCCGMSGEWRIAATFRSWGSRPRPQLDGELNSPACRQWWW